MELQKAIIHELVKDRRVKGEPKKAVEVEQGTLLDVSETAVTSLINSILKIYGTKGNSSSQGTFNKEGSYTFPIHLDNFLKKDSGFSFKDLSLGIMHNLKAEASKKNFATGGYIVFGHYKSRSPKQAESEMLLVGMVKKKDGITLNANMIPEAIQEVDLSKLHQAVRVNITTYQRYAETTDNIADPASAYLSFVSPKANNDASGYFIDAVGCTNAIPDKDATKNVLAAVNAFFKTYPELNDLRKSAKEEVATKLYEKSKSDDPECSLDTIDSWVTSIIPDSMQDRLANKFTAFANNDPYNVPAIFKSNSSEAKKGISLKLAEKNGWSLNLERTLLGTAKSDKIQFTGSSLTIRKLSKEVIEELRSALSLNDE